MNNLLKILIFSSPVLAMTFYYVIAMQNKHDVEIEHEDAKFERVWNEAEAAFARGEELREKYLARAREAEERIKKQEAKAREAQAKTEKIQKEFEKEIQEFDKKGDGK